MNHQLSKLVIFFENGLHIDVLMPLQWMHGFHGPIFIEVAETAYFPVWNLYPYMIRGQSVCQGYPHTKGQHCSTQRSR
jgi:hypothetical protein